MRAKLERVIGYWLLVIGYCNSECYCSSLRNPMSHAYTVTQIACDDQSRKLVLEGGNSLETTTTVGTILWNGTVVAGNMDKIWLCLSREL